MLPGNTKFPLVSFFSSYLLIFSYFIYRLKGKDLTIVTDTNNLKVGGTHHNIVDIIVHKDYNATNIWLNDIALLKVIILRMSVLINNSLFSVVYIS